MSTKEYYDLIMEGIPSDKMKDLDSYKKELTEEYQNLRENKQDILKGKHSEDSIEYIRDLNNEMIIISSTIEAIEYYQKNKLEQYKIQ